jgi:uncharacterized protein YjbJ (UPF0337 family)
MKPTNEKVKGYANTMAGKLKGAAGSLKDDPKMEIKGKAQEIKGKIQVASANAKESIKQSAKWK